jgi:outer membrane protein assembly factor BamB
MDSSAQDVSKLVDKLGSGRRAPKNATGKPMVFLLTKGNEVAAVDLTARKVIWKKEAQPLLSRIVVGRTNVYYVTKDNVLRARAVTSGRKAWSKKLALGKGQQVYGLAADGDRLYLVIGQTTTGAGGRWSSTIQSIDGQSGDVRWTRKAPGRLGAPAARSGYVFVPFRQQYVSVLDAKEGEEVVRIRARGEYVSFVRATPEGVFFGNKDGIFRLNAKAASGKKEKADYLSVKLGDSAGEKESGGGASTGLRVAYYWDGYEPVMIGYTAYDRNRLLWRAGSGEKFANSTAVVEYFRYFFGFDTTEGELKWVHIYKGDDVRSAAHIGESLLYVSEAGKMVALSAQNGDRLWRYDSGLAVQGATFDAEGFEAEGERVEATPLVKGLKEIIFDPDRRLAVAKLFAITQLKEMKGRRVSSILLGLISNRKIPLKLRLRAEKVLVDRSSPDSIPLFMKVLDRRYSYITGQRTRAVGPVALALATMKVKKAVPKLAEHLSSPHISVATLHQVVDAMAEIGGQEVLKPFRQFLLDYRAEPEFKRHIQVLTKVASTLLEQGGVAERQLLAFVAEDAHSLAPLKEFVKRRLTGKEEKPKAR